MHSIGLEEKLYGGGRFQKVILVELFVAVRVKHRSLSAEEDMRNIDDACDADV